MIHITKISLESLEKQESTTLEFPASHTEVCRSKLIFIQITGQFNEHLTKYLVAAIRVVIIQSWFSIPKRGNVFWIGSKASGQWKQKAQLFPLGK